MKKGICFGALGEASFNTAFAKAKKFGYDGVELSFDEGGNLLNLNSTEKDLVNIKKIANDEGIELYSVASGLYWAYSLTSDNEADRNKAKDIVKKQLESAQGLGCDTILIVPGATGVDFAPALGIVNYEVAYSRSLEAICELAPYAEKCGVAIGIENVWNKFLVSPLEMRSFIDSIGSDYVGSYFDVGNTMQISYPQHWIDILGKRIKKVHFKDFKCDIGNIGGFCDLLAGDVDYKAVMDAFKRIGYDGWCTVEPTTYKANNDIMIQRQSAAMDLIFSL